MSYEAFDRDAAFAAAPTLRPVENSRPRHRLQSPGGNNTATAARCGRIEKRQRRDPGWVRTWIYEENPEETLAVITDFLDAQTRCQAEHKGCDVYRRSIAISARDSGSNTAQKSIGVP